MNTVPMLNRLLTAALAFTLAGTLFGAEPNTLTEEEKAAGWRLLFDGKTTAGWQSIGKTTFPSKGWSVKEGTLALEKGGGGDIVTTEHFGDFEFAWEWKLQAGGNSGVKYNLVEPTKALGCEYQLIDDAHHPDGLKGGTRQTAALYDLIAPPPGKRVNAPGEWNQSRIVVRGNHVEHWLNGVKTVTCELGGEELKGLIAKSKYANAAGFGAKTKSPVLLQDHGDPIAFRSLKVRAEN